MGVQVAAELQDQVEGHLGTAWQCCETRDVGQEFGHGGGEVGGGDGGVEVVLEAVQVEVDDCDFAVELGVEGGGCARGLVHLCGDRRGHVC